MRTLQIIIWVLFVVTVLGWLGCNVWLSTFTNKFDAKKKRAEDTYKIVGQLRLSSDYMTRFVRQYTVTNNVSYKTYFEQAIRMQEGTAPYPREPWRNYWDLYLADGRVPFEMQTEGLQTLVERLKATGAPQRQIDLFEKSKANSDALVDLETVAMHAMEGKYRPPNPNGDLNESEAKAFSVTGVPNQTLAMELVHSTDYNKWKADIMRPLDEFATDAAKAMFVAAHRVERQKHLLFATFGTIFLMMAVIAILILIDEYREAKKAARTRQLAVDVTNDLAYYDVDSVRERLAQYMKTTNPDTSMVSSFTQLANNLEAYKPHLPEWVLPARSVSSLDIDLCNDDASSIAETQEGSGAIQTPTRTQSPDLLIDFEQINPSGDGVYARASLSSLTDVGISGSNTICSLRSDIPSFKNSIKNVSASSALNERADSNHSIASGNSSRRSPVMLLTASGRKSHLGRSPHHLRAGSSGRYLQALKAVKAMGQRSAITLAHITFVFFAASDEALTQFVDSVFGLARETRGTVHHFIGNTVLVSWGVASPSTQTALESMRFLARLRDMCRDRLPAVVTGACCTGPAMCRLGGTKQQQLVVEMGWGGVLDSMAKYAARHGTIVADEASARPLAQITSRAVGAVPFSESNIVGKSTAKHQMTSVRDHKNNPVVIISEILQERQMQDDEWMYQLKSMEKLDEAVDPVEMAIQACIKGDYGEAVRLLGDATASVVEMYPSATDSHTHREFSAISRPCDDVTFRNDNIDTNHCSRAQDGEGHTRSTACAKTTVGLRQIAEFLFEYQDKLVGSAHNHDRAGVEEHSDNRKTRQKNYSLPQVDQPQSNRQMSPAVPRVDVTLASLCAIPELMSVL